MKCRGHMLQDHSGYPVGSRRFVVRCTAEGFLKDSWGDLADQHGVRRSGIWPDVSKLGEGSAQGECGVRRKSYRLQMREMCYHLRRGGEKLSRVFIAED